MGILPSWLSDHIPHSGASTLQDNTQARIWAVIKGIDPENMNGLNVERQAEIIARIMDETWYFSNLPWAVHRGMLAWMKETNNPVPQAGTTKSIELLLICNKAVSKIQAEKQRSHDDGPLAPSDTNHWKAANYRRRDILQFPTLANGLPPGDRE